MIAMLIPLKLSLGKEIFKKNAMESSGKKSNDFIKMAIGAFLLVQETAYLHCQLSLHATHPFH